MIIKRTDSDNIDFQKLTEELDIDLKFYYKEETSFYGELNAIDKIKHTVVAYDDNNIAVGCGDIKAYSQNEIEIKRMYVTSTWRGKGIATLILDTLEDWSHEMNFERCILETLKKKPYAIKFFEKNNYKMIPNFGDYVNAENSICFEKNIE